MSNIIIDIKEIKEAFFLNLEDYTNFDDFEISKGLLWNFKTYTHNHSEVFKEIKNLNDIKLDKMFKHCNKKQLKIKI